MHSLSHETALAALAQARLYGILDLGYVARDRVLPVTRKLIAGGVQILQIRAKNLGPAEIAGIAGQIHPITSAGGVPLILNDHPALLAEVPAEGAHVGQDDLTVAEARRLAGRAAIFGKSTHSLEQAVAALAEGPDYIGFGPLFATPTKPDYQPVGLEPIREVHSRVSLPIFCIGGIKPDRLAGVLAAGATRVVIVSGLLQAEDIAATCRRALSVLRGE